MLVLTLCLVVLVVDSIADKLLMCNSFPGIQSVVLTVANFLMLWLFFCTSLYILFCSVYFSGYC